MEQKEPSTEKINYLYFGVYFALLLLLSSSSVFAKENLSNSRIFFLLYAAGQAAFETLLFIFIGFYTQRYLGKRAFFIFIGATFLFLIVHIFDYLMDRILDLSIWETFGLFVLDESLYNFFFLLDASGVPLWVWGVGLGIILLLPFLGIFLYKVSQIAAERRPVSFHSEKFLMAFFCLPIALLFWDFSASRVIHPDAYTEFIQSLPWKFTFLKPETVTLPLSSSLRKTIDERNIARVIAEDQTVLSKRPNIYLFIVESLRRDILTEETAPHLSRFSQQVASFDHTLSNANATNLSWFSIFHSQFAYHWSRLKKENWEMGSPPLMLLKKWGYKIRVYTSAKLGYYGLEKLLFGNENQLLDSYQTFHHTPPLKAADGDADALIKLQKDIAENPSLQEGQIFIVFWDSTHFDYCWPKDWIPKFTPFSNEFAYFKAFYSQEEIELIKNRYRNAVYFIDSLFGKFWEELPNKDEAIVLFTGDHGEEFFDHGHLFHNSHLTQEQTHVPLFMKFGSVSPKTNPHIASQIDLFPSVIDYLSGKTFSFFQGQSIFRKDRWPFGVVSRFNANRNPYEFYIHNGKYKFIARFSNRADIFQSKELQIRSLRSADDHTIPGSSRYIETWVQDEFGSAIEHLFE